MISNFTLFSCSDPNKGKDAAGRHKASLHEQWLPYDKMNKRYLQLGKYTKLIIVTDEQDVWKVQ